MLGLYRIIKSNLKNTDFNEGQFDQILGIMGFEEKIKFIRYATDFIPMVQ